MEILYVLLILLVVTKVCSEIGVRMGQPALIGELIGGVLLGLGVTFVADADAAIARFDTDETFAAILDIAVFFLLLVAGLEMRPKDLSRASGRALPVALAGMFVPLGMGLALGYWWLPESDWKLAQSLFIGVALAVTAVPVAVKVLIDLDKLQSAVGQVVVAAAVIDDILSLLLLAGLTALLHGADPVSGGAVVSLGGRAALFFLAVWLAGRYLLPWLGRILGRVSLDYAEFTLVVIFGLLLAVLAELLGMHFLIGAFAAGVFCTRNVIGEAVFPKVQGQFEAVTLGFLAPIFFASIGMHLSLSAIWEAPAFLAILLAFAIAGKVLGAGLAAFLAGFRFRDAAAVGTAMNARGAVEIIIADVALRAGLFDHPTPVPVAVEQLFSAVVIMAIVTTLASPIALRWLLSSQS